MTKAIRAAVYPNSLLSLSHAVIEAKAASNDHYDKSGDHHYEWYQALFLYDKENYRSQRTAKKADKTPNGLFRRIFPSLNGSYNHPD